MSHFSGNQEPGLIGPILSLKSPVAEIPGPRESQSAMTIIIATHKRVFRFSPGWSAGQRV